MSVVVYTPPKIQLERLMKREGLTEEEAKQRVDAQMDIEEKREKADWVVDNSKNLKHLQNEVEKFVKKIRGQYADIKIAGDILTTDDCQCCGEHGDTRTCSIAMKGIVHHVDLCDDCINMLCLEE